MTELSENKTPAFSIGNIEGGIVNVGGQLSIEQANVETPRRKEKSVESNSFMDHEDVLVLSKLRKLMMDFLSLTEIRTLCFDLGIKYDGLTGENLNVRVIDLLQICFQQNKLDELRTICRELNPHPDW